MVMGATGKAMVTGEDVGFSVERVKKIRLDDNVAFARHGQGVLNRIDHCFDLVVRSVERMALGGRSKLAISADIIVATPKAVMSFSATGIGIYP